MSSGGELPLILGGHTFIAQLGSDPAADSHAQEAVVAACLDAGICTFDTTYLPERVALGRCLETLGRRDEATVIAWNFFTDSGPKGELGGAAAYEPDSVGRMLEELRSERIEMLVVHSVGDADADARQVELAVGWRSDGLVGRLGMWAPGADAADRFADSPYDFMVQPCNIATGGSGAAFRACKGLGWENLACSPFVRGWELEKMVERSGGAGGAGGPKHAARVADHMLRYSLYAPDVDRLIVQMRRVEWVEANAQSVARGPLAADERRWLLGLKE